MGDIDIAFKQQYDANIQMLVQQKGSRFRGTVFLKPGVVGRRVSQDQLGPAEAKDRNTRHADTQLQTPDHQRRWATLKDAEYAVLMDEEDETKVVADPTSKYTVNGVNAMGRKMDDRVIAAASAAALTGQEGATTTELPATQKIAVAGLGLTIIKLITARKKMNAAEVDREDPQFLAHSAEQLEDLLNTTQATSAEFNTIRALVNGEVPGYLGFTFFGSERLETDSNSDRLALAFAKSGIMLALQKDITTDVSIRTDKSNARQVLVKMGIGAVRLEEVKVVQIACSE